MLTSFEVMEAANISRATLNNYISQGLLPRPLVKNPEPGAPTNARQIGYFPEEVLARLERIQSTKERRICHGRNSQATGNGRFPNFIENTRA